MQVLQAWRGLSEHGHAEVKESRGRVKDIGLAKRLASR